MAETEASWLYGKITDEAIEKLRARIGQLGPMGPESDPITRPGIMRYINGIGDDNPLWFDEEYASKTRWGGIIAPPTILHVESAPSPARARQREMPGEDLLPGVFAMVSGGRIVFEQPLRLGDTLRSQGGPHDVSPRRSSMAGRSLELINETTHYNQRGEVVATYYASVFRMERGASRDNRKYLDIAPPAYTTEEMEALYAHYEREHEQRRGDRPRHWEDTNVGDDLITILKGPLTIGNIVAYAMGWGYSDLFANRLHHLFLQNRPSQRLINAETNIEDHIVSAHWDEYFARQSGIPYPYDEGIMRVGWLAHLMTDWMGDEGFLRELSVSLRRPNMLGDISWCTGRITDKRVLGERHLVNADIWITNQRNEKSTIGTAIVELPTS